MKWLLLILFINFAHASLKMKSKNNISYMIEADHYTNTEIDNNNFHQKVRDIHSLYFYSSLIKNKYVTTNAMWETPYLSAWAQNLENNYFSINFWGGSARIPGMLSQTWDFIVCHELGHILGGQPKHHSESLNWASAEGQADHFAITECLPKYYRSQLKKNPLIKKSSYNKLVEKYSLPNEVAICYEQYSQSDINAQICLNILRAGRGFMSVLKYLNPTMNEISYMQKEASTDKTITESYPSHQCRIDIFREQSLCLSQEKQCRKNDCWFKETK